MATASRSGECGQVRDRIGRRLRPHWPHLDHQARTFTGLLTGGTTPANIGEVRVEIYRVFPADSDVGRTSGPPTFSHVEGFRRDSIRHRTWSLSDRDTAPSPGNLIFSTKVLANTFSALIRFCPAASIQSQIKRRAATGRQPVKRWSSTWTFHHPFFTPARSLFLRAASRDHHGRGGVLVAIGAAADRPARHAVPAGSTDLAVMDPRHVLGPGLASSWRRHRRAYAGDSSDVQRHILTDREQHSRAGDVAAPRPRHGQLGGMAAGSVINSCYV